MLENIKAHSIVVAKVAHLIARGLLDAGLDISLEKTTAGALLHDIGKTASLNSDENHAEIGQQICLQNHLDETKQCTIMMILPYELSSDKKLRKLPS